jgi:hypothetical protein
MTQIQIIAAEQQIEALAAEAAGIPHAIDRIVVRAVNKVGVAVRTDVVRTICREVTLKPTVVRDRNVLLTKAGYDSPRAVVLVSGRRIPLRDWAARQTAKGVSYAIRPGARKTLAGSFKEARFTKVPIQMASGHTGVFVRRPGGKHRLVNGRPSQLPIVETYGPSVPQVVLGVQEYANGVMEERIAGQLASEISQQAELVLGRPGGGL